MSESANDQNVIILITKYRPSQDGKTFIYDVNIKIDDYKYFIQKRFNQFHNLSDMLFTKGYSGICQPPEKTFTRPNDPSAAENRMIRLNKYLKSLLDRPDVFFSEPMLNFLEVSEHVQMLKPLRIFSISFSKILNKLSAVHSHNSASKWVGCCFSDTALSSKVGLAWDLIEKNKIGGLAIFRFDNLIYNYDDIIENEIDRDLELTPVIIRESIKKINKIFFIGSSNTFFVTDSDGILSLYKIVEKLDEFGLDLLNTIELHIKAEVVDLVQSELDNNKFASVGTDGCIRVFMVYQNLIDIINFGCVQRPLEYNKEALKSVKIFQTSREERLLVGTNSGQVFIYQIEHNPPTFLGKINFTQIISEFQSVDSSKNSKIFESTVVKSIVNLRNNQNNKVSVPIDHSAVNKLLICNIADHENVLIIPVGNYIFIMDSRIITDEIINEKNLLEFTRNPLNSPYLYCIIKPAVSYNHSITAIEPYQNFLFVSYKKGLVVYYFKSIKQPCLIYSNEKYKWGSVRNIAIVNATVNKKKKNVLMVSTSIGGLRIVDFDDIYYLKNWYSFSEIIVTEKFDDKSNNDVFIEPTTEEWDEKKIADTILSCYDFIPALVLI